ncbi:hypothetical protein FH972_002832 [Carpinus fangiana]|uniref:Uncharacterized protein n=1 Tax=Carpinus fangiana TaxID=176857 RepID=A0A5N6QJ70_9ROSI|nr:hypothetical protein FH972_002832 [Carpinus fangiana]
MGWPADLAGVACEPPRGWSGPDTCRGSADPPAGSLISLLDLVLFANLVSWWVGVAGVATLGGFSSILVAAHFS